MLTKDLSDSRIHPLFIALEEADGDLDCSIRYNLIAGITERLYDLSLTTLGVLSSMMYGLSYGGLGSERELSLLIDLVSPSIVVGNDKNKFPEDAFLKGGEL